MNLKSISRKLTVPFLVLAVTTPASAQSGTTPTTPIVQTKEKKCSSQKFTKYALKVYKQDKITKGELARIYELRKCLRPWAIRYQRNLGVQRKARLEIKRLTPYPGPNGTRWAVPYAIVRCESKGDWHADNPTSDARGPYQLLGHGEPWPVNSPARKAAHHRIAGNLFRNSGYSPWEASRGCWG